MGLSLGEVLNDGQNCFLVVLVVDDLDVVSLNIGVHHLDVWHTGLINLLLGEVLNDCKSSLLAIAVGVTADSSDLLLDLVDSLLLFFLTNPFKLILLQILLAIYLHLLILIRLLQLKECI